jgi:CheY-like chemotaxis protein
VSDLTAKRPVVLIVEDDFLIRMHAAEMIADAGFDVVEAASADEAILVLEVRLDITVVFTDIQMPGSMDGLKLAAAIRGRWPPIKIVATSGLVDVRQDDLPEGGRFLPKPLQPRADCSDASRVDKPSSVPLLTSHSLNGMAPSCLIPHGPTPRLGYGGEKHVPSG